MAYNKIVFEDGQEFTADDANSIQEQYNEAVADMNERQNDFALSLYTEQFEGDGATINFGVTYDLITRPVVLTKRLTDSDWVAETISEVSTGTTTQWYYTLSNNAFNQNPSETELLAGEYVRIGYIIKVTPHGSTHATGGSDEININDINGYSKEEIDDLVTNNIGVTETRAAEIAEEVKSSSSVKAVCRSVSSIGLLEANEIALYTS